MKIKIADLYELPARHGCSESKHENDENRQDGDVKTRHPQVSKENPTCARGQEYWPTHRHIRLQRTQEACRPSTHPATHLFSCQVFFLHAKCVANSHIVVGSAVTRSLWTWHWLGKRRREAAVVDFCVYFLVVSDRGVGVVSKRPLRQSRLACAAQVRRIWLGFPLTTAIHSKLIGDRTACFASTLI